MPNDAGRPYERLARVTKISIVRRVALRSHIPAGTLCDNGMIATVGLLVVLLALALAVLPRARLSRPGISRQGATPTRLDPTAGGGDLPPGGIYATHDTSPTGGWGETASAGHHGGDHFPVVHHDGHHGGGGHWGDGHGGH